MGLSGVWRRGVVLITLGAFILAYYLWQPESFQGLYKLIVQGDVGEIINYIRSFGPYAMLVSFLIVVFINSVAVLPNIFVLAANGIIFGVVGGTIISWLAESVGVTISFLFMRYFFRDYAHSLLVRSKGLAKLDEYSGRKGFLIMLIARCIPFIPSGIITAVAALSSIGLLDYILATFIGKLPSAFIEVTIGHDLFHYRDHMDRLFILGVISVVSYYLFLRYKKKHEI
jgi:uncharacterized membrane protein YdjX (TVP38/TMEM64 family)